MVIACKYSTLCCTACTLTHFCRIMKTAMYGDSHVWFDKPWRMPAVKAWAAILRLATNSEGIDTGMFLTRRSCLN